VQYSHHHQAKYSLANQSTAACTYDKAEYSHLTHSGNIALTGGVYRESILHTCKLYLQMIQHFSNKSQLQPSCWNNYRLLIQIQISTSNI